MSHKYPLIDKSKIDKLIYNRFKEGFLTLKDLPQPNSFKDMESATNRIVKAIESGENITIIGDYDVDGVTSTTLMKLFFEEINYPIKTIIPNRFRDGYGLSPNIIPQIKGTDLAITVDNGISSFYASTLCKQQGIELIITDHHLLPPQIPLAYAIINQKQEECTFPYAEVCGAQIAWYLIASLKNALNIKIDMMSYMELTSIAIIADMMPLQHINRAMVIAGLKRLNISNRPAILAFKEHNKKDIITAEDIGFFLAPLINSAGRMEDASFGVDFLTSPNIYEARVNLAKLIEFNTLRKETEQNITTKAIESVNPNDNVIVVNGEDWHEGVVGIVSARVSREFEKPCIVLSQNGDTLKGSGRSFGDCNLFRLVDSARTHLDKFGGHHSAVGLSLQKNALDSFKRQLEKSYIDFKYKPSTIDPDILGELNFDDIDFDLLNIIKKYEPYGQGNQLPKFISLNVEILEFSTMGKDNEHIRFTFLQNNTLFKGVKFKSKERFEENQIVTISYTLNENNFRNDISIQLMVDKVY